MTKILQKGVLTAKKVENMTKMTQEDYTQVEETPKTFSEIYKALPERTKPPKQAFVERIAELCMCSPQSVRMWIQGVQRPDALKQKLISEELNIPQEELFPPITEE